jgi:hypothetical protein
MSGYGWALLAWLVLQIPCGIMLGCYIKTHIRPREE